MLVGVWYYVPSSQTCIDGDTEKREQGTRHVGRKHGFCLPAFCSKRAEARQGLFMDFQLRVFSSLKGKAEIRFLGHGSACSQRPVNIC